MTTSTPITDKKLEMVIDWLSITFKGQHANISALDLIGLPFGEIWQRIVPKHGYDYSFRHPSGTIVMFHSEKESLGCHVVIGGTAIRSLAPKISIYDVLWVACEKNANITRLDLAYDLHDFGIDIPKFASELPNNKKGGQKTLIQSSDGGSTLYFNKRISAHYMRFYDKGIESKTFTDYKRIELELKAKSALAVAYHAYNEPNRVIGLFNAGYNVVKGMCPELGLLVVPYMGSSEFVTHSAKTQRNKTVEWLLSTCANSLGNELIKDNSLDILRSFIENVGKKIEMNLTLTMGNDETLWSDPNPIE